jgi:hypothetical protein
MTAGRFWTALGVLLTVAMIVLSALINYSFGYSLGTTETNGRIFGAVSVVAVGVMAVLPATASRDFCQEVDGLRARLDVAATASLLREKIERLNKSIENLRKQGAGQVADAQSAGFARMFQVEQDVARTGLSVLLALVIESVSCFRLLVIAGAHPDPRMAAGPSLPEWIGEWLTERAEPHPGTRVSFRELEMDFRRWVEGRPAPKLSSRNFARLIRAACKEVGLAVEEESVVGLQLISSRRILSAA